VDFSKILEALAARGYIEKYESGGEFYGWIPTFHKHQVINNRERSSELPDPLDPTISTRHPRVSDARLTPLSNAQAEVEYGNGKEMEVETERTPKPPKGGRRCEFGVCNLPDPVKCSESFDQFWINYVV
jgi:hypothetical protein